MNKEEIAYTLRKIKFALHDYTTYDKVDNLYTVLNDIYKLLEDLENN